MTPSRSLFLGAAVLLLACGTPAKKPPPVPRSAALAQATDPKLVVMTVDPTTSLIGSNTTTQLGVRIQVRALDLPGAHRPKLNLALVLDTSGSMDGPTIEALRSSAQKVVSEMRDGDQVSLIAFHSRVDLLAPNTVLDPVSRRGVLAAISKITARGTTDLAAGLAAGLQQVQARRLPDGINRVVLLSDGVPNASATLPQLIASAHGAGIGITTLGLGNDYDSTLLAQMARDTGGSFHYLEDSDAVVEVFASELSRMSTVVGRNLTLDLAPGPGVSFDQMPGLVIGPDGHARATIGDLAVGETRDLMIPIRATGRADGSIAELVDLQLAFDDMIGHSGRQTRDAFVSVKASDDKAAVAAAMKIDLEVQRIRMTAASAVLEAIAMARSRQVDAARSKLEQAAAVIRAASSRLSDPELGAIANQLDEVAKQLVQLVAQPIAIDRAPAPAVAPRDIERSLRRVEETATKAVTGRQ